MATPEFIVALRRHVGHEQLWIPGCTAVVVRPKNGLPASSILHGPIDPTLVEILVVQRADNGWWTPVTGIIDPGEEAAAAAEREVQEEAGVVAEAVRLLSTEVVGPMTYSNGDHAIYLDIAFLLLWRSGTPWPADGENTRACFMPANELPAMNARFERVINRALSGEIAAGFERC
ncbi:NUDIX domain-containing protein [Schaalia suimastitidis]|uniref:NUDIX domain-containing protein n=1 Tax=Schaalia suimastitidis TaxID=121163 RepID=UPI000414DEEE|nr:NUDIX domain-containing protein [Schaalia suimastitidis]